MGDEVSVVKALFTAPHKSPQNTPLVRDGLGSANNHTGRKSFVWNRNSLIN
jgi:hypothetical protein